MSSESRARIVNLFTTLGVVFVLMSPELARGAITAYPGDLVGFNAAVGSPLVIIDFDSIAPGTDITGQTIQGATFLAPAAAMIVVRGTDTFTPPGFLPLGNASNRLFPTSGENCLSPGGTVLGPGPDPSVEGDSIRLVFNTPVTAVGFDILEQLADGGHYLVRVYDTNNTQVFTDDWVTPNQSSSSGGSYFYGVVSTDQNIARLEFDDTDNNNEFPDANIGYDTLRIGPCPPGITCPTVSEWGMIAMAGLMLLAGGVVIKRRRAA